MKILYSHNNFSFSNDLNHGSRIQFHNVAVWNHMHDVLHFFNWLSRTYTSIYYDNVSEVSCLTVRLWPVVRESLTLGPRSYRTSAIKLPSFKFSLTSCVLNSSIYNFLSKNFRTQMVAMIGIKRLPKTVSIPYHTRLYRMKHFFKVFVHKCPKSAHFAFRWQWLPS